MFILKLAFRNVVRHRGRSTVICVLICFCTGLFVVGNAVFTSSDRGIKASFVEGFTGDFSISAASDSSFSLFGNEIPIVGEYEVISPLAGHDDIIARVRKLPGVDRAVSVVSGAAELEVHGWKSGAVFFGVSGKEYFDMFPSIRIIRGSALREGEAGILLNRTQADNLARATGRYPEIGEDAIFTVFNDSGFTLRRMPIRGVFSYATTNETLDRISIIDVGTARSLNGYVAGLTAQQADEAQPVVSGSVDDLFSSPDSGVVSTTGSVDLAGVEKRLADTSARDAAVATNAGAWNFILIKARPGASLSAVHRDLDAVVRGGKFEAVTMDWRGTAGAQAQMIWALRIVFNVGIVFLAFAAIIIIINSLTLSTLERSTEIGMMRAIGASRGFVSRLFVAETMMVTVIGAIVGVLLGWAGVILIGRAGIRLANPLLISLFGGATVHPVLLFRDAVAYFGTALVVGAVAWIYPVRIVLRSVPLQAMTRTL